MFLWGFLNYLFGIGVALAGTALWLALERKRWWLRLCFFARRAGVLLQPYRRLRFLRAGYHRGRAVAGAGPNCAPAAGGPRPQNGICGSAIRDSGGAVPRLLASGYGWRCRLCGVLAQSRSLVQCLRQLRPRRSISPVSHCSSGSRGGWPQHGRLRLAPRLACAAGLVFSAYLLLPSQIYGGSGADHRLPVAIFLLLIAGSAQSSPTGARPRHSAL